MHRFQLPRISCWRKLLTVALLLWASAAISQAQVNVSGELSVRGQAWNWFQDRTRVKYAFGEAIFRLALHQQRRRFDWRVEIEQPTLFVLPTDALLPGMKNPLGLGGNYFAANNGRQNTASAFISQAFVTIKGFGANGSNLQLGRFEFDDGAQITPRDPTLAFIKRDRIAGRLIGSAEWYGIGRSFDGGSLTYEFSRNTSVNLMAARPTRGVYDVNGMGEIDTDVQYADFTREFPEKLTSSEVRLFASGYHDGRNLVKVDNRPLVLREADRNDIRIGTFGASYILEFGTPVGRWDLTGWGAWQTGNWGVLDHRADAFTAEVGWQPPILPWHAWLRAAADYASGDSRPLDNKHETFFQPLPSERRYARFPFYTLQNGQDYMGTLLLRPRKDLTVRVDVHKVKLSEPSDLWYQGTGAFQNTSFGYTGQAGRADGGLANYLDAGVDTQITKRIGFSFYGAVLSGKATLTAAPHGKKAGFAYTELKYRF
jgi:Alginate export